MNEKELREIRRQFRPDKSTVNRLCGCYVNDQKQIIALFQETLQMLEQEEAANYLALLKKALAGTLGKNLINIEFSAQQVMHSDEHRLLSQLRSSGIEDDTSVELFFKRIIESLQIEGNYLILLAYGVYAVPYRAKDDTIQKDAGDEEYQYLVCSVCPVKQVPPELSYSAKENRFHRTSADWVVSAPTLGFLFPAFDSRATNLYSALYYSKGIKDNHQEVIDAIFHTEPPMPVAAQKELFETVLANTLHEECSYEVLQEMHEQIGELMELHKESKNPEPLTLSGKALGAVLKKCGVSEEHIDAFQSQFDQQFGFGAALPPANVIQCKKFEIKTPDVLIQVNPERSDLVETRNIDGSKYILIRADEGFEVNGIQAQMQE